MNLRFSPALVALTLLVPLAGAAPAPAPADDDITAMGDAQAPPAPPLGPTQQYRPLNFYTRPELRAFPAASVPYRAPACHGAYVAPPLPAIEGDNADPVGGPVYIAADSMQLNENGESEVSGSVEVRQNQHMMRADRATISASRTQLTLDGNVYLQDPAMTLEAGRAELTLDGSGSHIVDSRYAVHASGIRGSARAITRENQYRLEIDGGAYTTCEPGHAAWMLVAGRIRMDQEAGWGSAKHVRLHLQDVPVLYVPYVTFPIDKRRRTGVLYPTFSFSSSDGADLAIPYYLNLDPQYDLMLAPRWIENRGGGAEVEFRYLHGSPARSIGNGELSVSWLQDDKLYQDEDRYAARFHHSGAPKTGWQVFADVTDVSDNDYLDDIDSQLSVNRDAHLLRLLQLRRSTDYWTALARVQGYQTIDSTIPTAEQPYRRLPQLQAQTLHPVGHGIELGLLAEYSAFDPPEEDSALAAGDRERLEPVVRWSLLRDSYRLVPTVKVRQAAYALTDNPADETPDRTIPTASLDGTLFLERSFRLRDQGWTQTLEPRVYALWTPHENQDAIPLLDTDTLTFSYEQLFRDNRFSGGDRVGDAQQVSLALESRFIGPDGVEAGRIALGQATYFDDRRVQALATDPVETGRYSPLVANALWRLGESWNAAGEAQLSGEDGAFIRGSARAGWQDAKFRTLNAAYRYDKAAVDQAELSGLLPVDESWSLVGRWAFDFESARTLESLAGVEYESCCWRTRVIARRALDKRTGTAELVADDSIVFEIELKGLGSLGDKVSKELEQVIPGYEKRNKSLP